MGAKDEKEEEEESAGVKGCVVAGAKGVADSSVLVSHAGTDLAGARVEAPDLPAVGNLHDSLRSTTAVVGVTELRDDPTSKTPKKPSRLSCFSGLGARKEANKVKNTKYSPNVHVHKVTSASLRWFHWHQETFRLPSHSQCRFHQSTSKTWTQRLKGRRISLKSSMA